MSLVYQLNNSFTKVNKYIKLGTILKNTKWAIGVVVYTGYDTKIVKNQGHA